MESALDAMYVGMYVNRIGYESHWLQIQSNLYQIVSIKNVLRTVLDFNRIVSESVRLRIDLYLDGVRLQSDRY